MMINENKDSNIVEISSGIATKEFQLSYDENTKVYNLTICAYGEINTEIFNSLSDVREYLKINWNFSDNQFNEIEGKLIKNEQEITPNDTLDIDEQMHEYEDREAEYAENYAEWAECAIWG